LQCGFCTLHPPFLDPNCYQQDILHDLEHAIKNQIEHNYSLSLSHPSNASRITITALKSNPDIDKRGTQWRNMKEYRTAAAADFEGMVKWYYDECPDYAKRKQELRQQYGRVVEWAGRSRRRRRKLCGEEQWRTPRR
jgi:hypothetical protein